MYCINCGQQIPDGTAFCPNCGAQQTQSQSEPEAQAQPEQGAYTGGATESRQGQYQGQSQYRQSAQDAPVPVAKNDTKAIVSLCCGIFSVVSLFTGWGTLLGIIAAIVGLVFGIKARKEEHSTMANLGVILCACGLVICAIVFLIFVGGLALLLAL